MRVLVTGAAGYLGRALVQRLLTDAHALARPLTHLVLSDQAFDSPPADARVQQLPGDFSAAATLGAMLDSQPQLVFHLASVPGALAEREAALGLRVNLQGSLALLQGLADTGMAPRLVFASSIAVYGALGTEPAREDAPPRPTLSYGAHKWMVEIALADHARRGSVDGQSLRLPGIVARPPVDTGQGSAFMSLLLRHLAAGQAYECPVSENATAWWMSCPCAVDNLLHAAQLEGSADGDALSRNRCWQLPVLHASMAQVLQAAASTWDAAAPDAIRFKPDARIESLFGRLPPLHAPRALAAGFTNDGDLPTLLRRALD